MGRAVERDGRFVGIEPIFGRRAARFAYERHQPVDNRVGVTVAKNVFEINGLRTLVDDSIAWSTGRRTLVRANVVSVTGPLGTSI